LTSFNGDDIIGLKQFHEIKSIDYKIIFYTAVAAALLQRCESMRKQKF